MIGDLHGQDEKVVRFILCHYGMKKKKEHF